MRSNDMQEKLNDIIIANLREAIVELGTDVSKTAYEKWPKRNASPKTIRRRFGNWNAAKVIALESMKDVDMSSSVPREIEKMDWRQWLNFAITTKDKLSKENGFGSQIATHEFKQDSVSIVFSSDWHLGSISTNYETFMRNIEYIMETPNLYIVVVGDTIDNFLTFPDKSAMLGQILTPQYQKKMLKSILDELVSTGKLIATGWGDHDSRFEEKLSGSDVIKTLSEGKVPYFAGKGVLRLKIGSQEYTCAVTHKSRFSSYLNETHSPSQEYRTFVPADICVTGHHHSPAYSVCNRFPIAREAGMKCGGQVILIRTGSYKENDTFSIRFWNVGTIGTPTVVLYGSEWKLVPFSTAELAVEFMNGKKP